MGTPIEDITGPGRGETPRKSRWWRKALRVFAGGLLLGLLLAIVSISAATCDYFSSEAAFSAIRIGTPRRQAERILNEARINCGLTYNSSATQCTFSDFWRYYLVELDATTGQVVHKRFGFKRVEFVGPLLRKFLKVFIK